MFNRTMSKRRRLGYCIHALIDAVPKHVVMPVAVPTLFGRYSQLPNPSLGWHPPAPALIQVSHVAGMLNLTCAPPGLPYFPHCSPAWRDPAPHLRSASCASPTKRAPSPPQAFRSSPTPHLRGTLLFLPLIDALPPNTLKLVPVQPSAPRRPLLLHHLSSNGAAILDKGDLLELRARNRDGEVGCAQEQGRGHGRVRGDVCVVPCNAFRAHNRHGQVGCTLRMGGGHGNARRGVRKWMVLCCVTSGPTRRC